MDPVLAPARRTALEATLWELVFLMPQAPERAVSLLRDSARDDRLLRALIHHGLVAELYHAARRSQTPWPHPLQASTWAQLASWSLRRDHQARALTEALALLNEDHVPVVVLKGLPLGARLYTESAARPSGDLDLMVARRDLTRARLALERLGYRLESSQDELRQLHRHHHLTFVRPGSAAIELHFGLTTCFGRTLASEPYLARSVPWTPTEPELPPCRVLHPDDELFHLALHGVAHGFERRSWLLDLRLWMAKAPSGQRERALDRARSAGQLEPVALALALAESPRLEHVSLTSPRQALAWQLLRRGQAARPTFLGRGFGWLLTPSRRIWAGWRVTAEERLRSL